jgi:phage tail tube protein FII
VATGTGASGTVNHLELWIDGNKYGNYSGASMDASVPLAAGSHAITVIEVDSKGSYVKSNTVNVTVSGSSGGCQAPSTPGVNVCSPVQGATTGSPVTVIAAGEGLGGKPSDHMELWIDGSKIGDYKGAQLNTSVPLAPGSHAITVIEDGTPSGNAVKSNTVNITVTASGGCAAPGTPGVNLCSPTQGETTGSPVAVIAAGTGASGTVNHLELWVDGSKIGDYNGATMNSQVSLAAGSHAVTVIEVDSKWNYVKSNTANITVQ